MLVEINLQTLIDNKLTVNQFVICELLRRESFDILRSYLHVCIGKENYDKDINYLTKIGFLEYAYAFDSYDFKNTKVSTKFIKLISSNDLYLELENMYPTKVYRTNGTLDYLKTDKSRCRLMYGKITKNRRDIHEHIIKCLKYEIEDKNKNNSIKYMKKLYNWLASEEWKSYEDRIGNSINSVNLNEANYVNYNYGEQLE